MTVQYHPELFKRLKKVDVRIRKSFQEKIDIFKRNPHDPQLNNHALREPYLGSRSINITADWRAIYEEIQQGAEEPIAYFYLLDTHIHLYG